MSVGVVLFWVFIGGPAVIAVISGVFALLGAATATVKGGPVDSHGNPVKVLDPDGDA